MFCRSATARGIPRFVVDDLGVSYRSRGTFAEFASDLRRYECKLRRGQWQEPSIQASALSYRSRLKHLEALDPDPTQGVEEEAPLLLAAPLCLRTTLHSLHLLAATTGYLGW